MYLATDERQADDIDKLQLSCGVCATAAQLLLPRKFCRIKGPIVICLQGIREKKLQKLLNEKKKGSNFNVTTIPRQRHSEVRAKTLGASGAPGLSQQSHPCYNDDDTGDVKSDNITSRKGLSKTVCYSSTICEHEVTLTS